MVALRKSSMMTVADFLLWESGAPGGAQLIDGEPVAMAPPSVVHGFLQGELGRLIGNHLRDRDSPCDVIANGGVVPHFLPGHNVRIPDLVVTCVPVRPGLPLVADPVLIVEILSPSNQAETWGNVRACMTIASVREILVLRSDRVEAQILRRAADGMWPTEPAAVLDELHLVSIAMPLSLGGLYARTGVAG